VSTVATIFKRHGFVLNRAKLKITPSKNEQVVLGLRVNRRVEPSSAFETMLQAERTSRRPCDPKLKAMESYRRFITGAD